MSISGKLCPPQRGLSRVYPKSPQVSGRQDCLPSLRTEDDLLRNRDDLSRTLFRRINTDLDLRARLPSCTCSHKVTQTVMMATRQQKSRKLLIGFFSVICLSQFPLLPAVFSQEKPPVNFVFFLVDYHGSAWKPGAAIRDGDWKLIEFWEYDQVELYNLTEDISEKNNLAPTNPKKVAELQKKLSDWQKKINARMPERNPDYTAGQ